MIDIKKLAVVSGIGSLQKVVGVRNDGIIVEDFDSKLRQFIATRKTNFVLLEGISIYTDSDGVGLTEVLTTMRDKSEELTLPSEKADSPTLRQYFLEILPNYDRDRFHTSDMKKIIKWFNFMQTGNLLVDAAQPVTGEVEGETVDTAIVEEKNKAVG